MIYIDAAAGQEVSFKQKIQVAIPADYLQEGMQLYKGEENSNGSINWVNPDTLPENKQLSGIAEGKMLFESKCVSCHAIGKDLAGPDLAHLSKRKHHGVEGGYPDMHFRIDYRYHPRFRSDTTSKPGEQFSNSRIYYCNVRQLFGGALPTSFPDLKRQDINKIEKYILNESSRLNLPMPKHAYLDNCIDSCEIYYKKTNELSKLKALSLEERQRLINENEEMTEVIQNMDPAFQNPQRPTVNFSDFDKMVSPENYNATYYQFSLESFGWYNIDILLKDLNGVEESELFVRIVGKYTERINVFLIIPTAKVFGEGGPDDGRQGEYAFFYKNGKIPLPQNEKAYILAVTEQNEKIAFGLKEFITATKQELEIQLRETTKEEFEAAVKDFDAERLYINVDKSKNADSIRAKDKEIRKIEDLLKEVENLKPKGCDCDCGSDFPDKSEFYAMPDTLSVSFESKSTFQPEENLSIRAFPNPSSTVFTLKLGSINQKDKIALKVMDVSGRNVESRNELISGETIKIGESYKPGIYLATIIQGLQQKTIKLIKQ